MQNTYYIHTFECCTGTYRTLTFSHLVLHFIVRPPTTTRPTPSQPPRDPLDLNHFPHWHPGAVSNQCVPYVSQKITHLRSPTTLRTSQAYRHVHTTSRQNEIHFYYIYVCTCMYVLSGKAEALVRILVGVVIGVSPSLCRRRRRRRRRCVLLCSALGLLAAARMRHKCLTPYAVGWCGVRVYTRCAWCVNRFCPTRVREIIITSN